jgi:conjugative transfer region protein TrbK
MRALTVRGWGSLAAILVLVGVVVATLVSMPRPPRLTAAPRSAVAETGALARCRDLGPAAESEPACHAAWRALSQHFFGLDRKASAR